MNVLELINELACPYCKGGLQYEDGLRCGTCAKQYEIHDNIPYMIPDEMKGFAKEIEVQDRVAVEYEQIRYQDKYAKQYHNWWTEQMLAEVSTEGNILDNGCGIGHLFEKIPGNRVVGLDLSKEMLRCAAKRSDRLVLGNSQDLPFQDNSFNLVFCRSLLHHLPQPELAVREMHRVLKSKGEIVLVDTNTSLLSVLPRMLANRGKHFSEEHKNLSYSVLKRILGPHFSIDKVSYFGYVAYPLLGFPDLVTVFKYIPFKPVAASVLMCLDKFLSHVPLVRTQSWGILIKGTALDMPLSAQTDDQGNFNG